MLWRRRALKEIPPSGVPFFPQGKRFPHRFFFGVEPSAFNSAAGKGFLV
jgi:hypothetical protein